MLGIAALLVLTSGAGAFVYRALAATTWYVDDNTCPASGSGTLGNPFCKIQDAICGAVSGDLVSVAPGTYHEAVRMRPGVSLISQGGASVTTIDATGQPCTDNTFCAKRTGNTCSVVTFASGHTPSTVLDGFTITGGGGLEQNNTQVAGGGVFVFSSPTVSNNVITNNQPISSLSEHFGAGIYISLGSPIITGNVIEGNRLIPPNGKGQTPSIAYGAGVYVGFYAAPYISDNVIQNNHAGDPNLSNSVGAGGGVALTPGNGTQGDQEVTRNFIADNSCDDIGGGVQILGLAGTAADAIVTNNVIVGNSSGSGLGGGVYTAYAKTTLFNNTVVGNYSAEGGGMFVGSGDPTLPVDVINNIVYGNLVPAIGGGGGGIFSLNFVAGFSPAIEYNDLYGNLKNQIDGDFTDATTIGVNGNFSADPLFANEAARDFHLDPNSPAIDTGTASGAPSVDFDSSPRGVDGDGTPNSPEPGDVDVGAFEAPASCASQPEICDGIDNNCNGLVDEGFVDTDGDGMADCVDPDDDNDGVLDVNDCAPLDPTAYGMPSEVLNVNARGGSPTPVTYDVQNIGTGTQYQMVSGLVNRLSATGGFDEDFCIGTGSSAGTWYDSRPDPPPGEIWFFLIRTVNACGKSTLDGQASMTMRASEVCQNGIVDADFDGSPSDLDCDDNNPNNSPINPEICDGLDNNCDGVADDGDPGAGAQCGVSNVGTCQFGVTDCQGGGLVCLGEVDPGIEYCDGLDNDCDGIVDDHVIDTDGDGLNDCVDTDDDNDGVLDVNDCAPLDATAWGFPTDVTSLDIAPGSPDMLSWNEQNIGTATLYDVGSGEISALGAISFASGTCAGTETSSPVADPTGDPPPGSVYFYLVKSKNVCGPGSYGTPMRDALPVCP